MGRILVPIDPSRMGYQRQVGDYQSNYQSPFEGILPHVLVNTAIPLAGKVAGAGAQRYANYRGEQDLAAKRAQYEAQKQPTPGRGPSTPPVEPSVGGERQGPAGMERSPRAAAAGAMASPVQKGDLLSEFNYNTPANQEAPLLPDGGGLVHSPQAVRETQAALDAARDKAYRYPANVEDYRGYRGTMDWPVPAQPVETPFGPAVGPRTGMPISEAMVDEEGNPIQLAGLGKTVVNSVKAHPKTARAAAAGAIAGGAALGAANMGGYQPVGVPVATPGAPVPASGVAVGLPPSGPSAPPPVAAPSPPDTAGSASATMPGAPGAASTAPDVRRYGIPGGRRVDESAAVAALGDLTPEAVDVNVPPAAEVAGATPGTAAAERAAATYQPPKSRQLVGPGIHDYQTLMNAAAIAQTPEEKQQVLAAAERSGLVDAPSESWLDVINPGARTARGFAQLRGVMGDAGGKTDPLLAIKAENYASQIADRRAREADRRENDAYWAAKGQEQQAVAANAAAQQEAKTKAMVTDAEAKSRRLAFEIPTLTAKLGEQRARMIIAAQDAMDRGEMNDATMQFKRALAGRNAAETTKIYNMLPLWMRESLAKASMFDRMPAAGAQVTFGERREASGQDDIIKGHRADRLKAGAFAKALAVLEGRGDKAALDYVIRDPVTFGRLGDEIGRSNLNAAALKERLKREEAAAQERVSTWETEIKERGGTISPNGTVTFPPTGR